MRDAVLNLGSLFIIIPGGDHEERHGPVRIVVLLEEAEGVFECFAAATIHAPVQSPRSFAIVEARPGTANDHFVWILLRHLVVKILEILFSPFASIACPTARARMDPGIDTIERVLVLIWGTIFVNQEWRLFPSIDLRTDLAPVGASTLGENKDDGAILKGEVSIARGGVRSDVIAVGVIHGGQSVFGRVAIVFFGFVIHQSYVKASLARDLLENCIAAIEKWPPLAVPVHSEGIDAEFPRMLDLFPQVRGILGGIPDIDVLAVSEPGLVIGDNFWFFIHSAHRMVD